ncbi:chromosome partitioning protein ParB (plasmid) [Pandoraea faecigallinarum]|uniref:Chromosome partitioning protein ParB n=1 Tax=Pandoraea faecigallinarum TaxID=656179 RepID=A0A0H3X496_9BURK|nr:ParB N-terminal domain-containing protein [Pandoraea faecigallinarum]AKM33556.2 chromosome partitioning protein ParB [Pandoraea faecigallinarum]
MSKLLDRMSAIDPNQKPDPANRPGAIPRSAPGRMFEMTSRINEAEDKAKEAQAEAERAREELKAALQQLEILQQNVGGAGALEVDIATLVEVAGRRRKLSPSEYAELKANLAKNELMHPIVYRPLGDGRNEIVSGHNRVAIYRDELKRTTIPGIPYTGTAKSAELGAAFANLLAPSMPDFEKFRQFERLQSSGFTRSDIVEASGLSSSHVSRILAFEKLPPEALEAVALRPDRIGGNAAEEFASLASAGNAESVIKAIHALCENEALTQKRALEMARPKAPKATPPIVRSVMAGKRKLCDVTVRSGVIGLRFTGKSGEIAAEEWAAKIEAFMRTQLAAD